MTVLPFFSEARSCKQQNHHSTRGRRESEGGKLLSAGVQEGESCLSLNSVPQKRVEAFLCYFIIIFLQAVRSDSASDGQALGETRKQLKEETLLRLVRFRPRSAEMHIQNPEFIYGCCFVRA